LGISKLTPRFEDKAFNHDILMAKVSTPILGLDFFRKFGLISHPQQCPVMDKVKKPLANLYAATAPTNTTYLLEVVNIDTHFNNNTTNFFLRSGNNADAADIPAAIDTHSLPLDQ
jgi:hypothetical protein